MAQQFRAALIALALLWAGAVGASSAPLAKSAVKTPPPAPAASNAADWNQLKPQQQTALAPLAKDWNSFSSDRKRKWLGIAELYPSMTPQEQSNLHGRMVDWAKLTSEQREKARTQYKKLRTVPPEERRALEKKWQEYEALPADQKQRLKQTPKTVSVPSKNGSRTSALQPPKPVAMVPPAHKAKLTTSKPLKPTLTQTQTVKPVASPAQSEPLIPAVAQ